MEKKLKVIPIYKATGAMIKLSDLGSKQKEFVDEAIERYTYSFYEEKNCEKCDFLPDRHTEMCDNCASFIGIRQMCKVVKVKEEDYIQLPLGNKEKIVRLLRQHELKGKTVVKHRETKPFSRPIKFIATLYGYQGEAVAACHKRLRGIVEAPPRAGKTVIATALICEVGKKALILASQREWLTQFQKTFLEDEGGSPFTDAKPRQVKFCKSVEDFEKTDVCLATFQQFFKAGGKKVLKKIRGMFEIVVTDEVHQTAALETSRVLATFNANYMIGLTGTPERKRTSENVIFNLIVGPVIYKAEVERLRPLLELLPTKVALDIKGNSQAAFTRFYGTIETNKARLKILVKRIIKGVEEGHSVMVPLSRVKSVDLFVKMINDYFDTNMHDPVAVPFTGSLHKKVRDNNLALIKSGKAKVIVGSIQLLSTGLNIPRLSMLMERVTLTSNLPKCNQRVSRILTPMEGKKQPVIVYVMDNSKVMRSTARNEFWNAIKPKINPIVDKKDYAALADWFKGGSGDLKNRQTDTLGMGV